MRRSILLLVVSAAAVSAQTYTFSWLVGGINPVRGYNGDNIPAISAELEEPSGVAVDPAGNVYIADYNNQRIREISALNNYIYTIAGNGQHGYSGDGFYAPNATLAGPAGVAVDLNGNIYIADEGNNRIRKVSWTGAGATHSITTIAGTGSFGFGGDGGPAIDALLNGPRGVAVDTAGNIYIADAGNNRIRKISASTGIITTVAGNGTRSWAGDGGPATDASLWGPNAVAVDASGNIFIADTLNHAVREVHGGNISTVAGNYVNNTTLLNPTGVAVDSFGNVYIADEHQVRRVDVSTGTIAVIDHGNPYDPYGVTVDSAGNVYVTGYLGESVGKLAAPVYTVTSSPTGLTVTVDGVAVTTPHAFSWAFGSTHTLSAATQAGPTGTQYIFSTWNPGGAATQTITASSVTTYTANFQKQYYLTTASGPNGSISPSSGWYASGAQATVFATPNVGYSFAGFSGALSGVTNPQYLTMTGPMSVTANFGVLATISLSDLTETYDGTPKPVSVSTNPAGLTSLITYNGSSAPPVAAGFYAVTAIITSPGYAGFATGTLVINPRPGLAITTFAGNGAPGYNGDGGAAAGAAIFEPQGMATDALGNVYFADEGNSRIRKITAATGTITTVAGIGVAGFGGDGIAATSALLNHPLGVALDSSGNLYIADCGNQRVREVNAVTGNISTIAGGGYDFSDGIPATSAQFLCPADVALDSGGNLFVADSNDYVVRKVTAGTGIITTVAGNFAQFWSSTFGYPNYGDGGPATSAAFGNPTSIAVDGSGNLFVVDSFACVVRRVAAGTGIISTVAGIPPDPDSGPFCGTANDGIATSTPLEYPYGLALDSNSNLFIADTGNQRIRKVTAATGIISTVAGNGIAGFSGDGGAPTSAELNNPQRVAVNSNGNLFIADTGNNRIREVSTIQTSYSVTSVPSGLTLTVDGTSIVTPRTFTWDPGSSHTLSAIDQPGSGGTRYLFSSWSQGGDGSQTVIAPATSGSYTATFQTQYYLTTSAGVGGTISPASGWFNSGSEVNVTATPNAGNAFAAFSGALTGATDSQTLTMSGPLSVSAGFILPATITLGNLSAIYTGAPHGITAITSPTGLSVAITYSGSSTAPTAAGSYAVVATVTSSGYTGSATSTLVIGPASASVFLSNTDFTYDGTAKAVIVTTSPGGLSVALTYNGSATPPVNAGSYAVVATITDPNYSGSGNATLLIRKTYQVGTASIVTIAGNTGNESSKDGGQATSSSLVDPIGVSVTPDGNVFIADYGDKRIREVLATTGVITTFAGTAGHGGFSGDGGPATDAQLDPWGIAFDPDLNAYIIDWFNKRIRKVAFGTGVITTVAGVGTFGFSGDGGPAIDAQIGFPGGIAVDGNFNVFIADSGNNRIRKISADGIITTVAGKDGAAGFSGDGGPATSAKLNGPAAIALDAPGNLYIADQGNYRVRKVDAITGIITTIAGTGTSGYTGDGGAATSAQFSVVYGLTVDSSGNVFISDNYNNAIREVVAASGMILTVAGGLGAGVSADGPATTTALDSPQGIFAAPSRGIFVADSGSFADSGSHRIRVLTPPHPVTVTLGSLLQTYTGVPNPVTASTYPFGLATTITYNGSSTPPTAPGSYAVVATLDDTNYAGSGFGTLVITGGAEDTTFATNPAGLPVSVDGGTAQPTPFTISLIPGQHTIAVPSTQAGSPGTQFVFTGWSDSGDPSHSITVGASPATYTATFKTQYQLTAAASPAAGGAISPASGFHDAGSVVNVQGAANPGYQFANFSGTVTGNVNPQNITINGPTNVIANFTPLAPHLAATVGTRTVSGSTVLVKLTLTNTGLGVANDATITSITAISDVAGSGAVTVASGAPVDLGTVAPGSAATATVTFNWPSTAPRVSFTVNFTAAGGYSGSTRITTLY